MAGAAGTNVDRGGFIMDPTLPDVQQHYKEIGAQSEMTTRMRYLQGGYRTVKIPTASMLTLNTVPIQIVPAPGAGLLIIPELMIATMVFGTAAYACNASGASLKYGTAGAGTAPGLTLTQAFLQSSASANAVVMASSTLYTPASTDVNVPLTLIAATSDPTTGDSDLYVRVHYWIVSVPFTNPAQP